LFENGGCDGSIIANAPKLAQGARASEESFPKRLKKKADLAGLPKGIAPRQRLRHQNP
jgi:hypothetical protein